ncbi:MAG: MmcQ/YjbR family DNA-binding protein [Oscillospiraceae bacterium]|jgi:predicted DNA-binding protein (MmcQ/YjbR family)|nr:MmcQ/YjbR family DNA-binding protein [Oscillospiraceae bacterium]
MTRQDLISYCLTFPGAYEDYPFDGGLTDESATAVLRHRANKKIFALLMNHGQELYINLKCDPREADFLRQTFAGVLPGYHMNKEHWNTVVIGSDVPEEEIRRQIQLSFDLTKRSFA